MSGKRKKQVKAIPKEEPLKIDKSFEDAIKATMVAADKKVRKKSE
jgi:hypothetical protein